MLNLVVLGRTLWFKLWDSYRISIHKWYAEKTEILYYGSWPNKQAYAVPVILPRVRHPSIWQACWLHYY